MPPPAPTIGVATAGDATISVAFTGNGAGSDTYVANCAGITATGASSPITVTGLTNGTSTTCKVKGINGAGAGPWSANSNTVTPANASMLPQAPTSVSGTALDGAIRVVFTPGALGIGTLVNHTADCGGFTATGSTSPITVSGLANSTSYTCKVRTTSTIGTGPWSANSAAVTPVEAAVIYFHNDISGSPMLATDASGAVVWKENYRPYGERLNNQAGASSAQTGFTGKPFDASTGLSYMGARYYDPVLGRFMGVDPKGFDEANLHSFNRYAYANNNPYKYVDPDGHSPIDVAFLVYDLGKLGVALYTGTGVGHALVDVALSTVGVVSPIPGAGQALKAARAV